MDRRRCAAAARHHPQRSATQRSDTLRFDGAGLAEIRLPVGHYHYRLAGAGEGTVAVEEYSDEWLPRTATLNDRAPKP